MQLFYVKLCSALSMMIITLLFTMLPLYLMRRIRKSSGDIGLLSFLSCFGGGVFLATCLLDLFPDVQEQMDVVFKELKIDPNYPVGEFLLAFGFLTVLIIEQIVLTFQDDENVPILNNVGSFPETTPNHVDNDSNINDGGSFSETSPNHVDENVPILNTGGSFPDTSLNHVDENVPILKNVSFSEVTQNHVANYGSITADPKPHDHEISFHQDLSSHSILRSVLLVFALSLHSIFEGLAIGLQTSNQNVFRILVAVLIHKCIIAFTLGLNLTNSKLNKCNIIKGNVFFSLTSPIGIIIGSLVVDFLKGVTMMIASGILQGLAAGTFLYVTFFEVLPHELNSGNDRMVKMACLVLGFSVVSLLLTFLPG